MQLTIINKLTHQECNNAFEGLELKEKQWLFEILAELKSARRKHPWWPYDVVHRAAIIGEESGELTQKALQTTYENGPWNHMHLEAVQTASTCLRFLFETHLTREDHQKAEKQATCDHQYQQTGQSHKGFYVCPLCEHETTD